MRDLRAAWEPKPPVSAKPSKPEPRERKSRREVERSPSSKVWWCWHLMMMIASCMVMMTKIKTVEAGQSARGPCVASACWISGLRPCSTWAATTAIYVYIVVSTFYIYCIYIHRSITVPQWNLHPQHSMLCNGVISTELKCIAPLLYFALLPSWTKFLPLFSLCNACIVFVFVFVFVSVFVFALIFVFVNCRKCIALWRRILGVQALPW